MADKDNAVLTIWLVGGQEIKQGMPLEEAQQIQQDLVEAFETAEVSGSVTLGSGHLVRFAGVAATRLSSGGDGRVRVLN